MNEFNKMIEEMKENAWSRWELIKYYMSPDEIGRGKTLSDVIMDFFEDLMRL